MLTPARPLLLASSSPRRREMLERLAIPLVVAPVDVDESVPPGHDPTQYLEHVVSLKLAAARVLLRDGGYQRCGAVLVADTAVVAGEDVLGKPANRAHAVNMITRLSGARHLVMTRFALQPTEAPRDVRTCTVTSEVCFRTLSAGEVEAYVATGEGVDKAGGYGIQGIAAALVSTVAGSYTNIVGLPLAEVVEALGATGLWRPGYPASAT